MRLKLIIAYDGRIFRGWQKQPNCATVQNTIEAAIEKIANQIVPLHGSGRTDTGVHANGQVAHFDVPKTITMNPYNWVPALNSNLPTSIRILECNEVPREFHSRFSAREKHYSYAISLEPILHPLSSGLAWHIPSQIDPERLERALANYIGTHDFRNFSALRGNESESTDYHRTIFKAYLKSSSEGYLIHFKGSGFLYKMVRIMTGEAIRVAQWKLGIEEHSALLNSARPSHLNKVCAPADGLTLEHVHY